MRGDHTCAALAGAIGTAQRRAENAEATKSRFLAVVSHDLRQPLQSIELYLATLDRLLSQPEAQDLLSKARTSVHTMGDLLNALLDVSRMDGGTITPRIEDFTFQDVIRALVVNHQPAAQAKNISLGVDCLDSVIRTDRALLTRILDNLISNAIRYTNAGLVSIVSYLEGPELRIDVRDTGIGMPPEATKLIFEEYFQLDNPARDRSQGLGLGLAIVRHLSRLLGLDLSVESEMGRGTQFSLLVPLAHLPASGQSIAVPAVDFSEPPEFSVLLVDDEPAVLDSASMLMRAYGIAATSANSAQTALDLILSGFHPDVLVTDYRLPEMSGTDLMRRINELLRRSVPTILLTGDTAPLGLSDQDNNRCTVMLKPIESRAFVSLVHAKATT
jgi:CheY-like chemotaxis protein/two-component sensor histidine kinase